MTAAGSYRIHRMIQDLLRDPDAARAFAIDPNPAFERYGVTPTEGLQLEEKSIESMTALGVHPNLQMKYLRLRKGAPTPGVKVVGPLDAYLDRLQGVSAWEE